MQAGFARVEITPPPGEHPEMMGFGAFLGRTALEVAQPIHVRASYLEGGDAALLLSFDLCGFDEKLADEIRAAAAAAAGLAPEQVIAACTHTHSAPSVVHVIGWGEFDPATAARLPEQAARAARAARESLAPVKVCAGAGELDGFSYNRVYREGGPRDTRLRTLAFRAEDGTLRALWAHYACHPVVLCEACRVISPDFCGVAMQALEARTPGAVCSFLQGPCGDIDPLWAHRPQERSLVHLAHAAYRFRRAVEVVMGSSTGVAGDRVHIATSRLVLPVVLWDEQTLLAMHDLSVEWGGQRGAEIALPLMREEAARLAQQPSPQREVPMGALALGDHTVVFHPFEMFTAVGREVEAGIGGPAWVVGYANGYEGYAPTRDRFAPQSGDYAAHALPLMMGRNPYAPSLPERLAAGLVGLGRDVRSRSTRA